MSSASADNWPPDSADGPETFVRHRQDVQSGVDGRRQRMERARCTARTEATPIDIIFLIEQLERVIATGRNMPLTSNVIIDQARALDLVDQLRAAVPEEVRAAKRINEETERIVEHAREEAELILARAQEQAAFLIEERELTRAAEIKSQEIIAAGEHEADEIRRGADEYAQSVLVKLEGECVRALQSIRHGLAMLDDRQVIDGELPPDDEDQQLGGDGAQSLRQREPSGAQL